MYKNFIKPIWKLLVIYLIGSLSIASDIAQLTSFNLLDYLKKHLPLSLYFLIIGTLLLYLILVVFEFTRRKPAQQLPIVEGNAKQFIGTGNVRNSNIIQINKDKED